MNGNNSQKHVIFDKHVTKKEARFKVGIGHVRKLSIPIMQIQIGASHACVLAVGFAGIAAWGAKGAAAVKLPITVGPKKGGEKGPRGRL